jgi:hypothetical protein
VRRSLAARIARLDDVVASRIGVMRAAGSSAALLGTVSPREADA